MANKADIKKLLAKGLTGREIARLILQDNWDVDHQREGLLSERDVSSLRASLKTTQDIEDFNRFVDIYRLVDYTLKDARIQALEAQNILMLANKELDTFWLEDTIRGIQGFLMPAIVTQKQYDDLKAKQKTFLLAEINSLKQVIEQRAFEITPKEVIDIHFEGDDEGFYEYLIYTLREKYPDLYKQAVSEILEVIKAGRLRPVELNKEQEEALEALWKQLRESRPEIKGIGDLSSEATKDHQGLWGKEQQLLQKYYSDSQSRDSLAHVIADLEQILKGSLSEDEEYKLLEYTLCSGGDLYQTGLPEWIKEIDTYMPNLNEETAARAVGMMAARKVAIVQDPDPDDIDERGYWIHKEIKALNKVSGYQESQWEATTKDGQSGDLTIADTLKILHQQISEHIKVFLAIQAVTEAISKVVGVDFTEDLDKWYESLESYIELYNDELTPRNKYSRLPKYLGMPELDKLKLGKLKPTVKSVKYYQDRMAIALGKEWWNEAIQSLEFEAEDQDSLSQQLIKDIEEVRASNKTEEA